MDDFGDHEDQPPENDREDREEETTFVNGWRDESILDFDDNLDGEIPNPRKDAGVMKRAYTETRRTSLES